jgi:hypothetical protein
MICVKVSNPICYIRELVRICLFAAPFFVDIVSLRFFFYLISLLFMLKLKRLELLMTLSVMTQISGDDQRTD